MRPQCPRWHEIGKYCHRTKTGNRFKQANGTAARLSRLDVDPLRDTQCISQLDAQISNSAIDLGVAKQQLDRTKVPGLFRTQRTGLSAACELLDAVSLHRAPMADFPAAKLHLHSCRCSDFHAARVCSMT